MKRFFPCLILLAMGCSNPTGSPLELANAFQKAIERKDYEKAYNFIDDSLKEQTIPEDLELFFSSEESVLSGEASGKLLPVVASYPTFRIIEFQDSNPNDSCDVTDIVVVRNRDNIWSVVWADHLSSEVDLATDVHPFSTRCKFYKNGYYRGLDLSKIIPNDRYIRLKKVKDKLTDEAIFNLAKGDYRHNKGINMLESQDSLTAIFHLGFIPSVKDAVEFYLSESECMYFGDAHDRNLIALSQYLLLEDKETLRAGSEFNYSVGFLDRIKFGQSWYEVDGSSKFWALTMALDKQTADRGSYIKNLALYQQIIRERNQFIQYIHDQLLNGRPKSMDLIRAIQLLAMVKDKSNPEYIATKALAEEMPERAQTKKSTYHLTSSELQICEQSFSGMRDFYEPFELEDFCSCVFQSSAGFETFLDSPGEYLKENENCLERYLFRPAGMSEDDIESYWTGVDRASQPVTRDGFATSCAKGLLTLPEFKEIDYPSARDFCMCIYDEAEGKGLAMDDLMNSAGDDIAEACGHLISP